MLLANVNVLSSAFAEGGVEVDLAPKAVFGMVVLFVVLLIVLKPLLFEPMLKLFEERERRIDGAKKTARDLDTASAEALAKYESAMADARGTANAERERIRAEGTRAENEILGKVRVQTAELLEDGKRKAEAEAAEVRVALRAESAQLAREVASRVLGREVQS